MGGGEKERRASINKQSVRGQQRRNAIMKRKSAAKKKEWERGGSKRWSIKGWCGGSLGLVGAWMGASGKLGAGGMEGGDTPAGEQDSIFQWARGCRGGWWGKDAEVA